MPHQPSATPPGNNLPSFPDALWWVGLTTVNPAKAAGAILMIVGIAVIGTSAAPRFSWYH